MSGNKQRNDKYVVPLWEDSSDDFGSSDDDDDAKGYIPLASLILQRASTTFPPVGTRSSKPASSMYFTGQKRKRLTEEEVEEASTTSTVLSPSMENSQSDNDNDDYDDGPRHDRRLTGQRSPLMVDGDDEEEPIDSLQLPFSDGESIAIPIDSARYERTSHVGRIESNSSAPNANSEAFEVDIVARERHVPGYAKTMTPPDIEESVTSQRRDTSTTIKRKRATSIRRSLVGHKRTCYGSRNGIGTLPESKSFYIDDSAPYLSIIEGIEARDAWHREDFGEEYLINMLQEVQPTISPGHAMEMPAEAMTGVWTAEIVRVSNSSVRNVSLMSPDHLKHFRLHLRHESGYQLGSLPSNSTQHSRVKKPSSTEVQGFKWDGVEISIFSPRRFRKASIEGQKVVDLAKNPYSFIGSLSFTCLASGVFDDEPRRESPTSLEFSAQPAPSCPSETPLLLGLSRPKELPMRSSWMSKKNWGVSFLCSLSLDSDYYILYAQDTSGKDPKIVAVDGK